MAELPYAKCRPSCYQRKQGEDRRNDVPILLPSTSGVVMAWIFNIWGTADLFNAFYQANHAGLMAGQLGATYFIPTFIVPLLLITHGLGFRILVQHQPQPAMQEGRHLA